MKEIIIKVDSASIVVENLNPKKNREKIYKNKLRNPICDLKNTKGEFVECDTDEHNMVYFENVSNMLHVLMGDRPVPSKKHTIRKRNNFIDDIVERCAFIKELNVNRIEKVDKNGINRIYVHKNYTQGKKCMPNSNSQTKTVDKDGVAYKGTITWDAFIKRGIYSEGVKKTYELLIKISKEMGIDDVRKKYSLIDFLYEIRKNKTYVNKVIDFSIKNDTAYISHFMQGTTDGGSINDISDKNSPNLAAKPVNVHQIPKLTSGFEIILYVDDNVANIIDKGVRCATLLDGGVAYVSSINNVLEWENIYDIFEDMYYDGYTKVSDLKRFKYDN